MAKAPKLAPLAMLLLTNMASPLKAAEPSPAPPSPALYADLNHALANGDAGKVRDIARAMNLGPGNVHLLEAQLAFNLPLLLEGSKVCRDALALNAMPSAIACNALAYHAALNMGDAHEAFGALAWIKKVAFPYTLKITGKPGAIGGAFDHVDVEKLAATLPAFSATLTPGAALLNYTNLATMTSVTPTGQMSLADAGIQATPAVAVEVNGKKVEAFTDTGMPAALLMDQAHADALGVKPLVTGLPGIGTIAMGPLGNSLTLGLVDKLVVGPLTLRNMVAFVIPTSDVLGDRVGVGLPLLARFRQVSFGKSAVTVGGEPATCNAPLPLAFASPATLQGKLVFDATAEGKVVKASIDTGSTAPLIAGRALTQSGPGPVNEDGMKTRTLKVSIGRSNIVYDQTPVVPTLEVPDVMVGAPVIAGWDLRFNFDKPSLCFETRLPRGLQGTIAQGFHSLSAP
jgi:hypothetical protein